MNDFQSWSQARSRSTVQAAQAQDLIFLAGWWQSANFLKIIKVLLIDIIAFAKRIMDREHKITLNKWFVLVTYELGNQQVFTDQAELKPSTRCRFWALWVFESFNSIYRLPLLLVKVGINFIEGTVLFLSPGFHEPFTVLSITGVEIIQTVRVSLKKCCLDIFVIISVHIILWNSIMPWELFL